MYVHWTHPDPPTACYLCRPFIGGAYRLADIHPPPLHHRCRCSLQNLPEATEADLTPPPDWANLPEPVLSAWLSYIRWMLRRKIAIPLFLLPLLPLLKGDTGDDEEQDDAPSVGQPTPHRPIKLDATELPPMATDLPPTWTADGARPDPDAVQLRLPTAFSPLADDTATRLFDYPTTRPHDDATAHSGLTPIS